MLISLTGPNLPEAGTCEHESFSHGHTPAPAASKLANIITHLTKSSLQPSSIPTYTRAWKLFDQFHSTLFQTANFGLPITPGNLALFIAYLFEHNYAHSTMNTYISALSYLHKLLGLPDPTRVFYITQRLWQDWLTVRQPLAYNFTHLAKLARGSTWYKGLLLSNLPI